MNKIFQNRHSRFLSGSKTVVGKNESGMSLLEVTVASGIMLVLGLGIATMMANQGRQQNQIRAKADHTGILGNLRSVASSPDAVSNSLVVTD